MVYHTACQIKLCSDTINNNNNAHMLSKTYLRYRLAAQHLFALLSTRLDKIFLK